MNSKKNGGTPMINLALNYNLISTKTHGTVERERERATFLTARNVGASIARPSITEMQINIKQTTNQNLKNLGVGLFGVVRNKGHPRVHWRAVNSEKTNN